MYLLSSVELISILQTSTAIRIKFSREETQKFTFPDTVVKGHPDRDYRALADIHGDTEEEFAVTISQGGRVMWLLKSEAEDDAHVGSEHGGATRCRYGLWDSTGTSLTMPAH